jgi:ATP/maltotriose-dependent transcriptional regulator MalT
METVERFVRRFAETNVLARFWHVTVLADLGKLDEAAAIWATVLPHLTAFPRYTPEWIINQTSTADLAVQLNRPDVARTVYADLEQFADRQAMTGPHLPSRGPVARYLGMLARLLGDTEAAEAHLTTALHLATVMGAAPDEASTRVDLARLLLARRGPGDPAQAQAHLQRAAALAGERGMRPLRDAARALLAGQRGDRSTPLSAREEEVAALVAKGLSNRQIATTLHLSERTVETHVRSIFNKLGFDSRARVASWFASLPRD